MAVRTIIYLPNPILRQVAKPVLRFDGDLQRLVQDLFETMYHAKGVGLAAPQVGISLQLAVVDVLGDKEQQLVLANPQIIHTEGETEYDEGCLSVPGAYDKVARATSVAIKAQDQFGNPFETSADGLLGQCFQHEIDHLNGRLFIDHLSPLKRSVARRKMDKHLRQKQRNS